MMMALNLGKNFEIIEKTIYYRRKYSARLQEQEEHIESLIVKVNNLEKQKSRLQSEVEVLIIDLEKVSVIGFWCINKLSNIILQN